MNENIPPIPFRAKYFDQGGMKLNLRFLSKMNLVKKVLVNKTHFLLDLSDLDGSNAKYVKMFVRLLVARLKQPGSRQYRLFILADIDKMNEYFTELNCLGKLFHYYNTGRANMWILDEDNMLQRRSLYITKGKFDKLHMLFEDPFCVFAHKYARVFYIKYLKPRRRKRKEG